MHGNTKVYGFRNCRFGNKKPDGDETWFCTREARDRAMNALRAAAVVSGLSAGVAQVGIYPVIARITTLPLAVRDELEGDKESSSC